MDNTVTDNGAWGILFVPYAQKGKPSLHQTCTGIGGHKLQPFGCVMDPEGDALLSNHFSNDGYFGNPSNSDYGQITLFGHEPQNCFRGNVAPNGSDPSNLEKIQRTCDVTTKAANAGGQLLFQVLCDTGLAACPPHAHYPRPNGTVHLKPLPSHLPTMPNPCQGVPANPWCPGNGSGTAPAHQVAHHGPAAALAFPGLLVAVPAVRRRLRLGRAAR
jgi:hypothetical protein